MNTKTRPSTLHWQPALLRPEEYVCGLDDIHQAIHIILRTPVSYTTLTLPTTR
ncbi:hypothetical protein Q2402_27145, partial [Escherichia coli]|nr:hypothetical protein [Escherichia coli]